MTVSFEQQEPSDLQTRLEDASPLYILPRDDVVEEVLIPAFSTGSAVDCMIGLFTSDSLAQIPNCAKAALGNSQVEQERATIAADPSTLDRRF